MIRWCTSKNILPHSWTGQASRFSAERNCSIKGNRSPTPTLARAVFAVIDTASKTGTDNDATAVTFFALNRQPGRFPLVILDWDIAQIEGAILETWLPSVFQRLEELARLCRARAGTLGAFIEDKNSGTILLQQAQRRGMRAHAINSKLTAMGKDERAINVSGYASVNKKLVVIPEEAETVQLIFRRYLEVGSIRDLVEDLDRKEIRTRRLTLATGKTRGGIRFGVGALSHLLRNRFYIGEVNYKGKIHPGEQAPIVDRELFEAVQAKLAAGANARQLKLRASPSILAGRLFDDRGNPMTPTHTNKRGARYRYYVSHPILQKRNNEAGTVSRVSASDIEATVLKAARGHLEEHGSVPGHDHLTDQDLVAHSVERVILKPQAIEIRFATPEQAEGPGEQTAVVVAVPWNPTGMAAARRLSCTRMRAGTSNGN